MNNQKQNKQKSTEPVYRTVKQYKTLEVKGKEKMDKEVNKLAAEGWTLKSESKEKRFLARDKFRVIMEREVKEEVKKEGLKNMGKKLSRKQTIIIGSVILLFVVVIYAGIGDEPTSTKPQPTQPPPSESTVQEPEPTDAEVAAKQEKAKEDLKGYLNLFGGDPLYLTTRWRAEGIDNEIFNVEVNPGVWNNMPYSQKEEFVRKAGNISRAAGYNSLHITDNLTVST